MNKALESVASKGDLFGQSPQREECRIGQQPSPRGGPRVENDSDSADDHHRKHADDSDRPSDGKSEPNLTQPSGTARQTLRAYGPALAVHERAHRRVAQQQQKNKHSLLY